MIEPTKELGIVHAFLVDARKYGLVSEVVYFALKYMQENPGCSIEDAMNHGYYEWIK